MSDRPLRARAGLALVSLLAVLGAARVQAQPHVFPRYQNAAQVEAECQQLLADQKATEERLQALPAEGGASALAAVDRLTLRADETLGPIGLLAQVHPDKAIRDAADACGLSYQDFSNAYFQNAKVLALLRQVQPADAIDRGNLRDQLDAFADAGATLPPEQQDRARAINAEVTRVGQEYDRRIREDQTTVAYTAAELKGVPASVWRQRQRDAQGRYLLGVDYPTQDPVMQKADRAASRERMWRAVNLVGGERNLELLDQLAQLRREYAALFGFDSYADFILRRRMARNEASAQAFLNEVQAAVAQRESADLDALRAAKSRQLKTPLERTTLQRWDVSYYIERVRQARFAVDQDGFRRYFPPEASLKFVFGVAQQLFGVQFAPLQQALWHPEVRAYEVSDTATRQLLGTLYVDLFPRDGKYGHAAVFPILSGSTLAGRRPAAALVVNFDRKGLSLDELQTLLHEFGHAVHTLLSTTRYADQSGFKVQWDFVEAPSQMLEDWVYEPKVLALFRQGCPACKPVPAALIARADRARQFAKGLLFARQHLFASYDLALYGKRPEAAMPLWARMEAATSIGHVPGSMLPANFAHIASGGYPAGYYGYLWSLAVAEDLRTAFGADKLDAAVGRRYRASVLANGGQVLPQDLLREFLGRPTDARAFFKSLAVE